MRAYIIRRVVLVIPTVFLASLIVFFMIRLIPGSVIDAMLTTSGSFLIRNRALLEQRLGLDVPVFTQYGRWMGFIPGADGSISGILQGDFGTSLWRGNPVIEQILDGLPVTVELGLLGLIIAQVISLPIAIFSALRQDTWGDYVSRTFAILCMAVPGFWLATLIIVMPSIWWGYMPSIALIPFVEDPIGNLKMFIVPAIVLGMGMTGATMRLTRTMMLEVLRQDYIRTAWAKGLRERVVVLRHALKNALIPVVSLIGLQVPVMIGGTVIIEQIFCLPGIGRLTMDALMRRDYTIISGILIFFGLAIVLINLMVDLAYGYLDPRLRYR